MDRARPPPSACCWAWSSPPRGGSRCSAGPCPGPPARSCPRWARWSRGRPSTPTCPAGPTWPCSTPPAPGSPGATGGGGSTTPWPGWGWTGSDAGRCGPGRPGCASAWGWPRPCCGRRGCWSWTSRPTGSTPTARARSATCWPSWPPAGPRCSCPATCWPRSSWSAPGRRSSTGAGWSPRTGSRPCSARRGESWSPPPTSAPRPTWRRPCPGSAWASAALTGWPCTWTAPPPRPSTAAWSTAASGSASWWWSAPAWRTCSSASPAGTAVFLVELRKLVGRPRTWVTIGLLAGLPTLVAVLLRVTGVGPRPGEGPAFLAQVLSNGALFPAAALALVLPVFLPVAKLAVTIVFVFLAVLVVAGVASAVGAWLFGVKPLPSVSGQTIAAQDATWRTAATVAYVAWSMLGLAAVALFASTVTDSPLAAALGALAALVTSQVLDLLDAAAALKPYLPTHYWLAFVDLFRTPVLWHGVSRGFAIQAVYIAVFLGAAWANFATKDIKS